MKNLSLVIALSLLLVACAGRSELAVGNGKVYSGVGVGAAGLKVEAGAR